jgi:thiamine biosynthesis lipoprotein
VVIGIGAALIEVGGELYGYGRKPDGAAWQVLVEASPDECPTEAGDPCVVALDGIAVATSGDHWHAFEQQGTRYSHTLDPRTGKPVEHAPAAVTVIADDAMHADAWATALTVMGVDSGYEFAQSRNLAARFVSRTAHGLHERRTDAFLARLRA